MFSAPSMIKLENFKNGQHSVIFNKITQKKAPELNEALALPNGPLPKNQATYDFEYIVKKLLNNPEDVTFAQEKLGIICTIDNKKFNLTTLLSTMDPRMLQFSQEEMDLYVHRATTRNFFMFRPDYLEDEQAIRQKDESGNLEGLHYAHMIGINIYTSDYYKILNGILNHRDKVEDYGDPFRTLNESLIHIAMASAGLSQIPDKHCAVAYRAEFNGTPPKKMAARLKSIKNKADVTFEGGFVSTSKDALKWLGGDKIMFHDVYGKDVSLISAHPGEKEFLMPPTQMKWEGHKKDADGINYFVARPVMTPAGLSFAQTQNGLPVEQVDEYLKGLAEYQTDDTGNGTKFLDKVKTKQAEKLKAKALKLLNDDTKSSADKMQEIDKASHKALTHLHKLRRVQDLSKMKTQRNIEVKLKEAVFKK